MNSGQEFQGVENNVELGEGVRIAPFAIVKGGSILGDRVQVDHFAVVGGNPQFLGFDESLSTGVKIGTGSVIREGVTINRSTHEGEFTTIGEKCFLMANSHVAHDCALGNNVILANGVLLAGHVTVGDNVFFGGNTAVQQFTRIGEGAMVAGLARISMDVPPFVMTGYENDVVGLNLVGLKRRNFSADEIADLKRCFRAVYLSKPHGSPTKKAADALNSLPETARGEQFLRFFTDCEKRKFLRSRIK
ncbi:acyl-ACP--UDP-N-acetylglucosamine O-acyltransferase [Cerasicoccus fimbriatus]|uniref:acyl-ACP--UDP-N-acetylglucosamine O-acyltransferase n=1 Tax=Cerasicoccus fimbriatus TaxID=3014554 RepID=UPI0022B55101|nr:acyl-ACP--UDP-N-acetylglucosamine O-acyltransferase [Cerasicoccus sp. TK19100]